MRLNLEVQFSDEDGVPLKNKEGVPVKMRDACIRALRFGDRASDSTPDEKKYREELARRMKKEGPNIDITDVDKMMLIRLGNNIFSIPLFYAFQSYMK